MCSSIGGGNVSSKAETAGAGGTATSGSVCAAGSGSGSHGGLKRLKVTTRRSCTPQHLSHVVFWKQPCRISWAHHCRQEMLSESLGRSALYEQLVPALTQQMHAAHRNQIHLL